MPSERSTEESDSEHEGVVFCSATVFPKSPKVVLATDTSEHLFSLRDGAFTGLGPFLDEQYVHLEKKRTRQQCIPTFLEMYQVWSPNAGGDQATRVENMYEDISDPENVLTQGYHFLRACSNISCGVHTCAPGIWQQSASLSCVTILPPIDKTVDYLIHMQEHGEHGDDCGVCRNPESTTAIHIRQSAMSSSGRSRYLLSDNGAKPGHLWIMHCSEYMRKLSSGQNDVWDCISTITVRCRKPSRKNARATKALVSMLSVVAMPGLVDHQIAYFKAEGLWFRFDDMTNTRTRVTHLPLNNERESVVVLIYA